MFTIYILISVFLAGGFTVRFVKSLEITKSIPYMIWTGIELGAFAYLLCMLGGAII